MQSVSLSALDPDVRRGSRAPYALRADDGRLEVGSDAARLGPIHDLNVETEGFLPAIL